MVPPEAPRAGAKDSEETLTLNLGRVSRGPSVVGGPKDHMVCSIREKVSGIWYIVYIYSIYSIYSIYIYRVYIYI